MVSQPLPLPLTYQQPNPRLIDLPTELHLLIAAELPWPDLLAVKHAHPRFYYTIPTTVHQRVDWLLSRAPLGLALPQEKVNLRSDADFCRSREIRTFLQRRRRHQDCRSNENQCLVNPGKKCTSQPAKTSTAVKRSWSERSYGYIGRLVMPLSCMIGVIVALLAALALGRRHCQ